MTLYGVMSSHKPITLYMGLGANTLYWLFCFFKLFPMGCKQLIGVCMVKLLTLMIACDMLFQSDFNAYERTLSLS